MSLQDQAAFLSNIHPFQVLTPGQMDKCIKHMDIAYYPKNSVLISPEKISNHFFIIIKGAVYEYSADNMVVMDYHHEDSFDSNSLINNGKFSDQPLISEDQLESVTISLLVFAILSKKL